jgi:hypothetical protein
MRAGAAALAEPAVVEGERGEPVLVQPGGVPADDLLLDAGERPGQHDGGRPVGGHGQVSASVMSSV